MFEPVMKIIRIEEIEYGKVYSLNLHQGSVKPLLSIKFDKDYLLSLYSLIIQASNWGLRFKVAFPPNNIRERYYIEVAYGGNGEFKIIITRENIIDGRSIEYEIDLDDESYMDLVTELEDVAVYCMTEYDLDDMDNAIETTLIDPLNKRSKYSPTGELYVGYKYY